MSKKSRIFKKKSLVTRMGTRFFAGIAIIVFGISNAIAASYTCSFKYISCDVKFYLDACDQHGNTYPETVESGTGCNACKDPFTCKGGNNCPTIDNVTCGAGQYLPAGQYICQSCKGGNYCPGGTYRPSDSDQGLNPCPTPESDWTLDTTTTGLTKLTECSETRQATSISDYCYSGTLIKHPINASKWDAAEASSPVYAKAGSYVDGTNCKPCAKGTYQGSTSTATSCTKCKSGTYADTEGSISCKACSISNNNEGLGSWSDSQDQEGLMSNTCDFTCATGYTKDKDNRICKQCLTEKPCPSGYSGNYDECAGQTPEGDHCTITCAAGTYIVSAKATSCTPIASEQKKYIPEQHDVNYGSTSPDSVFKGCPNGATGNNSGATSKTHCYTSCPKSLDIDHGTATGGTGKLYHDGQTDGQAGYTNNSGCSYIVSCESKYGVSGKSGNKVGCEQCQPFEYSPGGENFCKNCTGSAAGAEWVGGPFTSQSECKWYCKSGYYANGSICSTCPKDETNYSPVTITSYHAQSITDCYISPTINGIELILQDDTGVFKIKDQACTYSGV